MTRTVALDWGSLAVAWVSNPCLALTPTEATGWKPVVRWTPGASGDNAPPGRCLCDRVTQRRSAIPAYRLRARKAASSAGLIQLMTLRFVTHARRATLTP